MTETSVPSSAVAGEIRDPERPRGLPWFPGAWSPRLRGTFVLVAAAGLAGLAWVQASQLRPDPIWLDQARGWDAQWVGRPAPEFDLPTLSGSRVTSRDLRGSVVLLHFWASWCPSCVPELPHYAELGRVFPGLRILHVSLDEEASAARKALAGLGGFEVPLDPGGELSHRFGTEKLPETYLIDRQGRVLLRFVATQPWHEPGLRALVQAVLLDKI
jgi:thiol-disulfide isomerase/thioredoxin